MENIYKGIFGKKEIGFRFKYETTHEFFGDYLKPCRLCEDIIEVQEEDFDEFARKWDLPNNADTEFGLCAYRCTDHLLTENSCLFHGAVFLWKDKAFLFTAESGTGKSTQLKNWMSLYNDEIIVLNGDKPILSAEKNRIMVYPSPWKGKERWGRDDINAELGGIIYLARDKENTIRRLTQAESIQPLLKRILSTFETEDIVLNACRFEDSLLQRIPVWQLSNTGDIASAVLTHDTLLKEAFTDEV